MRPLITGYRGYIGTNLFSKLNDKGIDWIGIDIKDGYADDDLCRITRIPDRIRDFNPDVIFHLAAIPRVAYSVENPLEVMKNNIVSTSIILEYAKEKNIPVIYSSSSSVVGNGDGPASPYALSKYVGELETLLYNKLYGLKTVALRYFNVYSYDQVADSEYATVVCNWKKHIKYGNVPYITGDGEQRRDMTHVDDIVSANIFCAENIEKEDLWGHWYDIGSGQNISLNELKEIVLQYFPEQQFKYVESRSGDVMLTKADLSKLEAHGWKSKVDLQTGLHSIYRILKEDIDNGKRN
tara:strand:+ start:44005 stop:44889 length:885 start_codon:yes stop_codon:yes gene_type:complete